MRFTDPTARKYIMILWKDLREANNQTRKFNATWERLNDELNVKLDQEGITDIVQRTKIKNASLALSDAFGAGKWWREKAIWLAAAIQGEQAAMELLNGE